MYRAWRGRVTDGIINTSPPRAQRVIVLRVSGRYPTQSSHQTSPPPQQQSSTHSTTPPPTIAKSPVIRSSSHWQNSQSLSAASRVSPGVYTSSQNRVPWPAAAPHRHGSRYKWFCRRETRFLDLRPRGLQTPPRRRPRRPRTTTRCPRSGTV